MPEGFRSHEILTEIKHALYITMALGVEGSMEGRNHEGRVCHCGGGVVDLQRVSMGRVACGRPMAGRKASNVYFACGDQALLEVERVGGPGLVNPHHGIG